MVRKDPLNTYALYNDKAGTGRVSYVDRLQESYPTLLHTVYRYAIRVLGATAHTEAIVDIMNKKAAALHPECPERSNLGFNTYHFWNFFHKNDGRLIHSSSKPRVTDKQKEERVAWCKQMKELMAEFGKEFYIAFLDEKWFFSNSRRKFTKILPRAEFESEEDAFVPTPRVRNRRFPVKVMCMGLVGRPIENKFEGRIMIKRVSEPYKSKRHSFNQNISTSYEINHSIKNKDWKKLFEPIHLHHDITVEGALAYIGEHFNLEPETLDHLCFSYQTKTKSGKSKKWIRLHSGYLLRGRKIVRDNGTNDDLTFDDLMVHKHVLPGTVLQRDTTCDSDFMLKHIREIGQAIRDSYHFVPTTHPIFLVMDNAGGHGTNSTKSEYERILKEDFNIIIIWQVPNSPESNMLDLGAWVSVQSNVERIHRTLVMQNDVLSESITSAFENLSAVTLNNIYDRWVKVLDLILKGEGDNELVEKCRKKNEKVEDIVYVKNNNIVVCHEESSDDEDFDILDVEEFEAAIDKQLDE